MEEDWSPPFQAPPGLPRPAAAQPNGMLRLLPPVREVAFSGAPAERQPYETDGTVVASRQTCFGERLEMLIQARHPLWSSNMVLSEGACAPDGILRGPRGGVHRGDPSGVRVGEARGAESSGQCGQACSAHLDRGAAGEEAQKDRATSTQVGEEEGEAKEEQAVAGHPHEEMRPRTPPKYPQRPSTPPTPPRAGPMSDVAMGSTDLPLPPPAVGPTALPVPPPPLEAPPTYS